MSGQQHPLQCTGSRRPVRPTQPHRARGRIAMKLVTGVVSQLRPTVEVSGNQHGVGTSQILAFRIGKQAVELGMPSLPQVENGDEVAVAGDVVNGVLIAQAYRNFNNNARGEWKHRWLSAKACNHWARSRMSTRMEYLLRFRLTWSLSLMIWIL